MCTGTTRADFRALGNMPSVKEEFTITASVYVNFVSSFASFIGSIFVSSVALFLNFFTTSLISEGVTGLSSIPPVIPASVPRPSCRNSSKPPGSKVCLALIWDFMLLAMLEKYSLNLADTSDWLLSMFPHSSFNLIGP